MTKLKSLNKKLLRLEASMQKDARKLAKLKRKVQNALKENSLAGREKSAIPSGKSSTSDERVAPATRKTSQLTPAGREKLSALMKARWEAKRAQEASSGSIGTGGSGSGISSTGSTPGEAVPPPRF